MPNEVMAAPVPGGRRVLVLRVGERDFRFELSDEQAAKLGAGLLGPREE